MATTYVVTGADTGIPRLPNDSVLTGLKVGDTFTTTLDAGVEAELIGAGLIAKAPLSSPVVMLSDGTLAAKDGRAFSHLSGATSNDLNYSANTGPVITDQSDGHTYRIISTAGVLSTVLVS